MPSYTVRSMSRGLGGMLIATMFLVQPTLGVASGPSSSGIVGSIVKAPISPDGDVAGARAGFVINLAADMDPSMPGTDTNSDEKAGLIRHLCALANHARAIPRYSAECPYTPATQLAGASQTTSISAPR